MQAEPCVTFRNLGPSEAIIAVVKERAAKLSRINRHVQRCEVMIESPHRHQYKGQLFHVRVLLTLPGGELVAGRDPMLAARHVDVYAAIRDAFAAAERQLKDFAERRRERRARSWSAA